LVHISTAVIIFKCTSLLLSASIFTLDENASLLELFHEIYVQAKLAETIFPINLGQAHEHVKDAITTLDSKNWTTVAADRDILRNMLLASLNALHEVTRSRSLPSSYSELKGEVAALDNFLSQFTVSYIGDQVYKNSTIQALIISELANDISEKYGRAFGVAVNSSNMMTMMMAMPSMVMDGKQSAIPATSPPPPMSSSSIMSDSKNSTRNSMITKTMTMNDHTKKTSGGKNDNNSSNSNSTTISDVIDCQTAQALAREALQIFNKDLKPVASTNVLQPNMEVQRYLEQLNKAIDNRASVMDIMTMTDVYLHGKQWIILRDVMVCT
jgi:hypothetical protein